MNEARQVLDRLERIDALRREGAPAAALLTEVRNLLTEGERWIAAEKLDGDGRAQAALADCRAGLGKEVATGSSL